HMTVVAAVIGCHAHAGLSLSVAPQGHSGHKGDVRKRAVVVVMVKNAGGRVAGDVNIVPAVVIVVERGDAERIVLVGQQNPRSFAHVRESSIAVIVIEEISARLEAAWAASHRDALILAKLP